MSQKIRKYIKLDRAVKLLEEHRQSGSGKLFSVKYIKVDGIEIRKLLGRFNVKSYLKGGILKYNPIDKGLMVAFDLKICEYRMINLRGILSLKINGKSYLVSNKIKTK